MSDKVRDNPQLYVEHIDAFAKNLTDWEKDFISGLVDNPPVSYSPKRIRIIKRLYDEKC